MSTNYETDSVFQGGWRATGPMPGKEAYGSGTAARFFFNASYILERLEAADLVRYCAKASRSEREAGLDPRQIKLLREWCQVEVDEIGEQDIDKPQPFDKRCQRCGKWYPKAMMNERRPNSTCSCEEPIWNDNASTQKPSRRNTHATLKPIALCRYLATLLLPPAEYAPRRLLVPFAGVASEMIGALLAGWEEVVGVELEAEHVNIGQARLAYWQQRRWELHNPDSAITATTAPVTDGQLDMFSQEES